MRFTAIVVLSYAVLVLLGGLIGYLFANSLPSLIAGSVFGGILFACGMGLLKANTTAFFTALAGSAILTVFFIYRYWVTGQLSPAGMMAVLSALVFLMLFTTKAPHK